MQVRIFKVSPAAALLLMEIDGEKFRRPFKHIAYLNYKEINNLLRGYVKRYKIEIICHDIQHLGTNT